MVFKILEPFTPVSVDKITVTAEGHQVSDIRFDPAQETTVKLL